MKEIINQQEVEKKWEREAIFQSVWNNGIIVSVPCKINVLTHQVVDIESCDTVTEEDLDILQSEHIVLDGVYYEVFAEDDERLDDVANIFTPTFWY